MWDNHLAICSALFVGLLVQPASAQKLFWTQESANTPQELGYDVCSKHWNEKDWSKRNSPKIMIVGVKPNSDGTFTATCFGKHASSVISADEENDVLKWNKLENAVTEECTNSYPKCYLFSRANNLEKWAERQQDRIRTKSRFASSQGSSVAADFAASLLQGLASGLSSSSGGTPVSPGSAGCRLGLAPGESRTGPSGATRGCR